jgi:peptidoglycan/LPS O-acetylase OafA/YrhL
MQRRIESPALGTILAYAMTFALASWSYLVIEQPMLRLKKRVSKNTSKSRAERVKPYTALRSRAGSRVQNGALRVGATP